MSERPQLTLAVIEGLKRQGLNQSEIARMFGVTHQAVSFHVRKYGGSLSPRAKAMEAWPWMVPSRLGQQSVCRRLRDHCEYVATGGAGMGFEKLSRLKGFYLRCADAVVEFDPAIPPSSDASLGGFAYRPRLESDGDLLIRVNEHTHLSDEGRDVWVMPAVLPDPLMRVVRG